MNVTGTFQNSSLNDGVYQTDGGCIVNVVVEDISGKCTILCVFFCCRCLSLHSLNSSGCTFISIKHQNSVLNAFCSCDHRHNFLTDSLLYFLDRIEVHRVTHCKKQLVLYNTDRHNLELLGNIFRYCLCHGNGNCGFGKVYVLNTKLKTKGLYQLCLCNDSC